MATSARDGGEPLVEAAMLAATPGDRRAATVLVRRLLRHPDQHRVTVLARARTAEVAAAYRNLGFHTVDADADVLLRPAKGCHDQPAGTPTRS